MIWTIERLGRKGDGVALSGNDKALAPLTLPCEVIEGEAADGRIAAPRIVTPSPDRVRAPCPHYRACGGCSLMHATNAFTTAWKTQVVLTELESGLRKAGVTVPHVQRGHDHHRHHDDVTERHGDHAHEGVGSGADHRPAAGRLPFEPGRRVRLVVVDLQAAGGQERVRPQRGREDEGGQGDTHEREDVGPDERRQV